MKYLFATILFLGFLTVNEAGATAYYVDFSATNGVFNGLATTTAFSSLDAFTEVARSAGDIAFVRRGVASTTYVSDLNFTSDGTIVNPIIISADYDNLWNDFASSTQTYTVAVATSTFTASAAQSEIIVGEWVYVDGDCAETYNSTSLNQCEFAYEVSAVASTSISFYLPYKGNQTGAGHTLRILSQTTLGSNPQWNVNSGIFDVLFNTDHFWMLKGIRFEGNDGGVITVISSRGLEFTDLILAGAGATRGIHLNTGTVRFNANKLRFFGVGFDIGGDGASDGICKLCYVKNSLFTSSNEFYAGDGIYGSIYFEENLSNNSFTINSELGTSEGYSVFVRNSKGGPNNALDVGDGFTDLFNTVFVEDIDNVIGANAMFGYLDTTTDTPSIQSTTTVLRSGGGSSSIRVRPSVDINSRWKYSNLKLFEYPIYTNTTSKQYDIYFMSTSTSAWTADPLATELWIECEYWAHDTNATSTRKIKKSTGVLDFNGVTTWNALSVTCVPTQTGILYLRGWYAKTLETGKMNEFFVDGRPVIQ